MHFDCQATELSSDTGNALFLFLIAGFQGMVDKVLFMEELLQISIDVVKLMLRILMMLSN